MNTGQECAVAQLAGCNVVVWIVLTERRSLVEQVVDTGVELEPVVDAVTAGEAERARRAAENYLAATERIMLEDLA